MTHQDPRPSDRVALTQKVSREVHGQDDADREDADHDQKADDVTLEGQVVNGVFATLLTNLLVSAAETGGVTVCSYTGKSERL